ncbi:acyl-CoA dehydrogenase family protein [Microbacterium sp.]|uniref:acyl-CoA dehydrogenase family protein n=1 Tax=Microbacterium sp. TaxID=51671 RepID=UPI003C25EF8D
MGAVAALDLFSLNSHIGEEEAMVRDTARQFVERRIKPEIADWYERAETPVRELALELGELGVLGMHLEGYGCAGASATAYGLVCTELEAGDSGIRSLVSVQGSLAMFAIWRWGSDEHKQEWLPRMARGEAIGCFGLTEPDCGSDPAAMRTNARRDGDDWVLNGSKMWITNAPVADVAVVWAQTEEHGKGRGIRGFVVPTNTPGFSAPAIHKKMSLRASSTGELVMDNVRLPASAMLPEAVGLRGPLECLNEARFGISFGALGAARDCLEATIEYAGQRQVFGRSLASFQLTQTKLADMTLELGKGMLLALHLGALKDRHELRPEQISLGKLNSVRESIAIARECRTVLGAAGITLEFPVMRHANNLESVLTYEGTSEVHQLMIGQALTGTSAFR